MLSPLALSAQKSTSPEPILKTEIDSISYIYGIISYRVLSEDLQEQGVVVDTTGVKSSKIRNAILKENNRNREKFITGLIEGLNAPDSKKAFDAGHSLGVKIMKERKILQQLHGENILSKFNTKAFVAAMETAMRGDSSRINNPDEMYYKKMEVNWAKRVSKIKKTRKAERADRMAKEERYMAENRKKDGVISLPNGLQYKVIKKGTGEKPKDTDFVVINYHGTLNDGTIFKSNIDLGYPVTIRVNEWYKKIRCWPNVLQLMPVGSKWIFYIPYDLAYGPQDTGPEYPISNLIFEIELLNIERSD